MNGLAVEVVARDQQRAAGVGRAEVLVRHVGDVEVGEQAADVAADRVLHEAADDDERRDVGAQQLGDHVLEHGAVADRQQRLGRVDGERDAGAGRRPPGA